MRKPRSGEFDIDMKTRNALLRSLRCQGERGFVLMKQRWHAMQHISLDDSGCPRGLLLIVLCRFSAVVAGWRVGAARCARGGTGSDCAGAPPFRVAGTGDFGHAGAGRAHSRRQQVRNASFQGQVRLIFSTLARAWRTSRAGRLKSR